METQNYVCKNCGRVAIDWKGNTKNTCQKCEDRFDNQNITDIIYDKLMGNSDMLDLNLISSQEIEAHRGRISFTYMGRDVNISVSSTRIEGECLQCGRRDLLAEQGLICPHN